MKKIAVLLPVLAGIMFGAGGVFVRTLKAAGFDNVTIIYIRCLLAIFIMLVYILFRDRTLLAVDRKSIPWMLCCGLIGMLGTSMMYNISSTNLSLAFAAVLLSIAPVYTVIISGFLFKESITLRKVICMVLCILGAVLVSGVFGSAFSLNGRGILAGILSGLSYGCYSIFSKITSQRGVKSITITFYNMVFITAALILFADHSKVVNYVGSAPASHVLFLVFHSVCLAVVPYLFLTIAVEYIEPGRVSILASCEPVAAMVFGIIFFAEMPTVLSVVGLLLTIAALAILCRE